MSCPSVVCPTSFGASFVSAQYASASSLASDLPSAMDERYTSTPPGTSSILVMNSCLLWTACLATEFSVMASASSRTDSSSFPDTVLICRMAS